MTNGLSPRAPRAPYKDRATGNIVLSRYHDVLQAFRDTRLWPAGSRGEDQGGGPRDDAGIPLRRSEVQESLAAGRVDGWQAEMTRMVEVLLAGLRIYRPVDLLRQFAMPWCLNLGRLVMGIPEEDVDRLSALAALAWPDTGWRRRLFVRRRDINAAIAELDRYFTPSPMPMGRQTFVGTVQTLPRLLASGWLALFRDPVQVARLRENADLMPRAVDELLRYAGIIPRLYRRATGSVALDAVRLADGDRLTLMIASANRDPEQFPDPNRLDIGRPGGGQLSLGIGRGSCAGARLVRMAFAVSIGTILEELDVTVTRQPHWRSGHFCWPTSVKVWLRSLDPSFPPLRNRFPAGV